LPPQALASILSDVTRWRFLRECCVWLAVGMWAAGGAAWAVEPLNYVTRRWQTEDGLPQNAVTSITQTRDGYMWVGTYSGLARFDGLRFKIFNAANTPALRSGRVTSLVEGPDGTLWIGGEAGEVTRYNLDGSFSAVVIDPKWGREKVIGMAFDRAGDLWLASPEAVLMRVGDGLKLFPRSGRASNLATFSSDQARGIWVTRNGLLSELSDGQLTTRVYTNEELSYVQGVCVSRAGGLWVASESQLRRFLGASKTQDLGAAPWGGMPLPAFLETRQGWLVAGTQEAGIFVIKPDGAAVNLKRSTGFPTDWISCLYEDREGNIWAGSGGNGLIMFRPSGASAVDPPDQWRNRPVLCVTAAHDGALWIGSEGSGLYRLKDGVWKNFGGEEGLPNYFVWSVCEDAAHRIWAGTWGGGLLAQNGDRFEPAPGLNWLNSPVTALLADGPGQLWIGSASGLLRYDNGKTNWFQQCGAQSLTDVRCVQKDKDGAIWFGMLGGGLGYLSGDHVRVYHKSDGLGSDYIQCLHGDADGALWIGSFGGGLIRWKDGQFCVLGLKQGLSDDIICAIEDDSQGNFWVSSHAGVMRLSKAELNACANGLLARVRCVTLNKGDGLPTQEFSGGLQPAGCVTEDGRLWFASSKGLGCIDPSAVKSNPLPPPVSLEEIRVDDASFAAFPPSGPRPHLQIPPGRHRLEFIYAGLSFAAPEAVRFRYRLEGLDSGWTDAGTKRAADYNYVPPGHYTFHVLACNNSEIWNNDGAALEFDLLPFFWQTWWFGAVMGTLALGLVGLIVWLQTRRRMRQKMEALERQQAIEHERSRIARDIHDELGSNLTRITMLSEPARHETPGASSQIYDIARQLTHTMDEIVWAVNPQHDTLEGLVNYLEKFAQDFLAVAGIRCRLDLPMQLPAWPLMAETRHNLFLAFKEALHNVVKHAGAREARVSLQIDLTTFTLGLEDDGRGFTPSAPDPSRNGLSNMRRRLEKIGGQCDIRSYPGGGAKVTFIVPLTMAAAVYRRN
jgi:signal transduction histidine kinase/ligand-binding sensor domain-containing protein